MIAVANAVVVANGSSHITTNNTTLLCAVRPVGLTVTSGCCPISKLTTSECQPLSTGSGQQVRVSSRVSW